MKNNLDETDLSELGIDVEQDWDDSHWGEAVLNPKDVSYAYKSLDNPNYYFCFMSCGESILIDESSYDKLKEVI